ncbi:hypothetical protein P5Y53_14595 [Dyella jiangningensis]|jgi:hypothetical protein|uniref:hypothetical protein n=1 Tax=Dyella jiangningensis TaxID=1379159 RepID=UPI00240EEC45|nr:hypothetical protein [Dyella jiangningensis]MDG2538902.1 hypothetical protein [Dyella jiangningensis]
MTRHHDEDKTKPRRPEGTSGYPEPQPTPRHKEKTLPDANSPHEPQNNPRQKPKPSS